MILQLSFPAGAFDCWAYMSCKEAIQAFMARISPDSLMAATSSLLLVRAELWHYSLQKVLQHSHQSWGGGGGGGALVCLVSHCFMLCYTALPAS